MGLVPERLASAAKWRKIEDTAYGDLQRRGRRSRKSASDVSGKNRNTRKEGRLLMVVGGVECRDALVSSLQAAGGWELIVGVTKVQG